MSPIVFYPEYLYRSYSKTYKSVLQFWYTVHFLAGLGRNQLHVTLPKRLKTCFNYHNQGLRTPRVEIVFTARP